MAKFIVNNLPDHISGDTFSGRTYTITINGTPANIIDASIVFKPNAKFSVTTGELQLDANNVTIKEQIITLRAANYTFSLQVTLVDGAKKTYVKGTWKITN